MKITIKLGGPLRQKVAGHVGGELVLEVERQTWTSDVLCLLGLDTGEVALLMLNGCPLEQDKLLSHSDRLALFPRSMAFGVMSAVRYYNPVQFLKAGGERCVISAVSY